MREVNHPGTLRVLRDGARSPQARQARLDSWANTLTALGTGRDKTTSTLPYADILLNAMLLEILYHSDDIAARIVTALPDECFKRPYKIVSKKAIKRAKLSIADLNVGLGEAEAHGQDPKRSDEKRACNLKAINDVSTDDESERAAELEEDLNVSGSRKKQHEAHVWGRLYGQGAILIGAIDGNPEWMPLDLKSITSVDYQTVLDKRDLIPWRWYANPFAPRFGDVALYQLQPVGVYMGQPYSPDDAYAAPNAITMVHESRLIQYGGELTSKREKLRNQGADYSILQKCFRALQLVNNNWQSASVLLADASQAVIKIKGLMDMISQQPTLMQDRMELVDLMRSVTRAMILDADNEDFERKGTPFAGISDMLDQSWTRLSSAARMPKIILMGDAPKGLGDTGASEIRWWFDSVACEQEQVVKPNGEKIVRYHALARGYDNPEDWVIVFQPLWQMTEKEQAELHLLQAQADQINYNIGLATSEELAISRFGTGEYSLDTQINVESRKQILQITTQQAQAEAQNALAAAKDPPPTPGEAADQAAKKPIFAPGAKPPEK